ncbi:MAG: baseplate J/gp47 family protein [Deltaproteobacteria bacterium]|nr:baseplate J/gp47 family protein [Deltaproteobacteria bacterium]
MAVTLQSLVRPLSRDDVRKTVFGLLKLAGFPVTSWDAASVPRALVEAFSASLSDLSATVANIARGGFLGLAQGDWLTLLAAEIYSVDRRDAVFARGHARLTDSVGGPFTIMPGQLWAASKAGLRFNNVTGGTLPLGGKLDLLWQAESPGAAYNVPSGDLTTLLTPLPGVSIENLSLPSLGTWLVRAGVDVESDAALAERCRERWSTLGAGGHAAAYAYHVKRASEQVTRERVYEATPKGGHVTVVIASSGGPIADATVVKTVAAYLEDGRRPQCVTVHVIAAKARSIVLAGEVRVQAALRDAAEARIAAEITALQSSLDIGARVPVAELIQRIMDAPGVGNVSLRGASGAPLVPVVDDIVLAPDEIATFVNALSYVPT